MHDANLKSVYNEIPSSVMLHRTVLVRIDVSEEHIAPNIRVSRKVN
jgi:hypothetical protein